MTENQFKNKLYFKDLSEDDKIELIQWYIDNYPVQITSHFGEKFSSRLEVKVYKGGEPKAVEYAIKKLKEFFKEK